MGNKKYRNPEKREKKASKKQTTTSGKKKFEVKRIFGFVAVFIIIYLLITTLMSLF